MTILFIAFIVLLATGLPMVALEKLDPATFFGVLLATAILYFASVRTI